MVEYTKTLKVGDGTEDGVFLGPVQNEMQYGKVKAFFDDVEKNGMKVAVGGAFKESGGYFIQPTIIDSPKEDSKIVQEEPFGESIIFVNDHKKKSREKKDDVVGVCLYTKC